MQDDNPDYEQVKSGLLIDLACRSRQPHQDRSLVGAASKPRLVVALYNRIAPWIQFNPRKGIQFNPRKGTTLPRVPRRSRRWRWGGGQGDDAPTGPPPGRGEDNGGDGNRKRIVTRIPCNPWTGTALRGEDPAERALGSTSAQAFTDKRCHQRIDAYSLSACQGC